LLLTLRSEGGEGGEGGEDGRRLPATVNVILIKDCLNRDQDRTLQLGLRDQQAVERVFMLPASWQ
jgi:hypothetical protein